jgi:hypothetical protein
MKCSCWQHCFFLRNYAFKKCWLCCCRLGYDNDPALLQFLFYQSRIIPFYDTYPLLNIEIHYFKLAVTLTIVQNSDNCTKYCIQCCPLINSSLFNEFVCNLGIFCFFLTSGRFLNTSETSVLKPHAGPSRAGGARGAQHPGGNLLGAAK